MGKIKNWWKKINTPFYKRTLESLEADEKKDRTQRWFHFGIFFFSYIIVLLIAFGMIEIYAAFITSPNLWLNTRIIIICISLIGILILFIYLSNMFMLGAFVGETQTTLKHMTIQIKQLQQPNKNEKECMHRFPDNNPETKCMFCGISINEAFNKWLNENQDKYKGGPKE